MSWKPRTMILPLALALPVALAACSGGEAEPAARRSAPEPAMAMQEPTGPPRLEADRVSYDFGDIPIRGGTVSADFQLQNNSDAPVRLAAVYSSCMCTTALLAGDGWREGPFGMPGHDLPTTLDREVAPGEAFELTMIFDPMAHGPDAVGPVRRAVAIHTADGGFMQLETSGNVIPGDGAGDGRDG